MDPNKTAAAAVAETTDAEDQVEKIPYPKSVFFIVSNEFCERFCYYGMRTILVLYLKNILAFSESDSKIIYHAFTMFVYFFPVFGAILSDTYLGKFRTIFYVSIIYACGSILLSISAAPLGLSQVAFSMIGLLLIAIGTGGIKPCVAAFGGDQFKLPQQELQLATFFSLFYFSINAGSLISTFLTPILREQVHCFGADSCYPLAFAVPGVLMIVSIVIFGLGKPLYHIKKPEGNIVVKVSKCISHALGKRMKRDKTEKAKEHWLDYAEDAYDKDLIDNIKATLKVLVIYIPLPIFWALYDQQGSGWTFQAVRMDGDIGFYTILPEQMQVVNPLMVLAFIPLFTYVVYPALAKCHLLRTPLQRMSCGGFLAALAFGVSACISLWLESTYPVLPEAGNIQLRAFNPSACELTVNAPELYSKAWTIAPNSYMKHELAYKKDREEVDFAFSAGNCGSGSISVNISQATAYGLVFTESGLKAYVDNVDKSDDGNPLVRIASFVEQDYTISNDKQSYSVKAGNYTLQSVSIGKYKLSHFGNEFKLKLGGTYQLMVNPTAGTFETIIITDPNSVHILWLLVQYFIITMAEIMFSITGLEFSYSQAPASMKSVLQACWLLTTAFGNLIIVIIESSSHFEKQSYDFFLYTGLMLVDMVLFAWLAIRYKYVKQEASEADGDTELSENVPEKEGIDNKAFDS